MYEEIYNEEDGTAEFSKLEFKELGIYSYKISEINTGDREIKYDEKVQILEIEVKINSLTNKLEKVIKLDNKEVPSPVEVVFTNYYGNAEIEGDKNKDIVEGTKTWEDNDNEGSTRPESIVVNLLADGEIVDEKVVTESDGWTWKFIDLPLYQEDGETEIVYTVEEEPVDGYTSTIEGFNITNTLNATTEPDGEENHETIIETEPDNFEDIIEEDTSIEEELIDEDEVVPEKELENEEDVFFDETEIIELTNEDEEFNNELNQLEDDLNINFNEFIEEKTSHENDDYFIKNYEEYDEMQIPEEVELNMLVDDDVVDTIVFRRDENWINEIININESVNGFQFVNSEGYPINIEVIISSDGLEIDRNVMMISDIWRQRFFEFISEDRDENTNLSIEIIPILF